jgi:hypothetical protein
LLIFLRVFDTDLLKPLVYKARLELKEKYKDSTQALDFPDSDEWKKMSLSDLISLFSVFAIFLAFAILYFARELCGKNNLDGKSYFNRENENGYTFNREKNIII